MRYAYFCSAIKDGKVHEMRIFYTPNEVKFFSDECRAHGFMVEHSRFPLPDEPPQPQHEVQYTPPPQWGGRVVCVETGWIFKSITAASKHMHGSQWALRKAVLRNTVYHGFHWRMYGDISRKIDKFT